MTLPAAGQHGRDRRPRHLEEPALVDTRDGVVVGVGVVGERFRDEDTCVVDDGVDPAEQDAVAIPGVVYTSPELAWVGLTEAEAREKGYDVKIGTFPFAASGRAMTLQSTEGFVKMVVEKDTDLVLGVHIFGPHASDILSEASLALEMGATATDIALTIHAHPTLGEAMLEGAEAAHKQAIHIVNR